jgi:glycosyltransferase involved in cell wall biosynthesis
MSHELSISAVIPCYNSETTIARAVNSVIQQTARVIEIIIVDDASSDKTINVVEQIQRSSPIPIRAHRLERNAGPARARNAGWELANGDYIAFLDADDSWHPCKISIQSTYIAGNPAAVLCGHRRVLYRDARSSVNTNRECASQVKFKRIAWHALLISNAYATSSVIVKNGIPYRFDVDVKVKGCEDYLLWCEITHAGHCGYWTQEALAFTYKEHFGAGGLSGNLAEMGRSQRVMIAKLRGRGMLSRYEYAGLLIWSWCKLMRRYAIVALRK